MIMPLDNLRGSIANVANRIFGNQDPHQLQQQLQMLQNMGMGGVNPLAGMMGTGDPVMAQAGAIELGLQQLHAMDPMFVEYLTRLEMISGLAESGVLMPEIAEAMVANLHQQYGMAPAATPSQPAPTVRPTPSTPVQPRPAETTATAKAQNASRPQKPVEMYNALFHSRGLDLDMTQKKMCNREQFSQAILAVEHGIKTGEVTGTVMDFVNTLCDPKYGAKMRLSSSPEDNAYVPLMHLLGRVERQAVQQYDGVTAGKAMGTVKQLMSFFDSKVDAVQIKEMTEAYRTGQAASQQATQEPDAQPVKQSAPPKPSTASNVPDVFQLDKVNARFAQAQSISPDAVTLAMVQISTEMYSEAKRAATTELQKARARTAMGLVDKVDLPAADKARFKQRVEARMKILLD